MSPDRRWVLPLTALIVAVTALGGWLLPGHPLWPLAGAGVLFVAAVTAGVTWVGSGIFGPVLVRGPAEGGRIALTFDDGPDPVTTAEVARLLEERGHRGTFFVVGERAAQHADLVARLVDAGHDVGVHSFDHSLASSMPSMAWLERDFRRSREVLEQAVGRSPRFYRPPVGLLNPRIHRVARTGGWTIACWSVRARDGVPTTSAAVLGRVLPSLRAGAVVLLHDRLEGGEPACLGALPPILDELDRRGLRSVTLSALSGIPAFAPLASGAAAD